tara:strand:- start:10721 stop:11581 length:861 start_codon:yes stop_codon:yes gene_type:complete
MADVTLSQLIESSAPGADDIIEISQLSTTVTISASTISALASDNSLNDSVNGFAAAGFASGDHVKVVGFTGDTANNIFTGEITDLAPGKMTFGGSDGDVIVDDAAGEMVTISKWVTRRAPRYGKVLLQEITLGSAGEFDFNNIPQGFNRLIVEGVVRSTESAPIVGYNVFLNSGLTAANYHAETLRSVNGAPSAFENDDSGVGAIPASTAPANSFGRVRAVIEAPGGTDLKQVVAEFHAYVGADSQYHGFVSIVSDITAVISRVRLRTANHPTNGLLGTLRLYGEN